MDKMVKIELPKSVAEQLIEAMDKLDVTNPDDPYSESWEVFVDKLNEAI